MNVRNDYLNGAILIRGRILINKWGEKCLSRQNGSRQAQEVPGMFVKDLTDPVSRKSVSAIFYINTKLQ
jgi:hypothetical protein